MKRVLYFTAAWCGPCKAFRPILNEVMMQTGVSIEIIDVDVSPEMAQKLQVMSVPTLLVIDSNGKISKRNSGVMSKDALTSFLR